jgi:hypothetical protein
MGRERERETDDNTETKGDAKESGLVLCPDIRAAAPRREIFGFFFFFPTKLLSFMVQGCVIRFLDDATILAYKYIHMPVAFYFKDFPTLPYVLEQRTHKIQTKTKSLLSLLRYA